MKVSFVKILSLFKTPFLKAGKVTVSMEFNEALPTNILQEMVVCAIYPGVLTCDKNRTILSSFRSG